MNSSDESKIKDSNGSALQRLVPPAQGVAAGQNQRKGKTLIATSRPRRESRARYTSPMPPEPSTT